MVIVSLAGAKDDPEVTSGMHNTGTHSFHHERRTLGGSLVDLHSVLHEQEDHKRFEFLICEMP